MYPLHSVKCVGLINAILVRYS